MFWLSCTTNLSARGVPITIGCPCPWLQDCRPATGILELMATGDEQFQPCLCHKLVRNSLPKTTCIFWPLVQTTCLDPAMNSGCPGGVLLKTSDLGFELGLGFVGLKVRGSVLHQEPVPARQKRWPATSIQGKGAAPGSNSGAHVALGEASVIQFY